MGGLEPSTSVLWMLRSNQLNYIATGSKRSRILVVISVIVKNYRSVVALLLYKINNRSFALPFSAVLQVTNRPGQNPVGERWRTKHRE